MQILRDLGDLHSYFKSLNERPQILADTGFLYALAHHDDRLFNGANDVFDFLADQKVELYANVISRMEFIDLVFRKQVTNGCIQLFNSSDRELFESELFKLLKDIRDKDTVAKRMNQSYKIDERRLKKLRSLIEQPASAPSWREFCDTYVGQFLINEWAMHEEELGLNFIEVMEGAKSNLFHSELRWLDMVHLMGEQGLRGPDAMILNMFIKSKFPLLITTDGDFDSALSQAEGKAVYFYKIRNLTVDQRRDDGRLLRPILRGA